jgi:hypothetical protein
VGERAAGSGRFYALRANVWARAAIVHPLLCVSPWVVIAQLLARRDGSELTDISWALPVAELSALVSFVWTLATTIDRPLSRRARVGMTLVGMAGSFAAAVLGLIGWLDAADVACHGRYECPI